MKFSDLELHPQVLKGTEKAGFESCMPVQEKALPVALQDNDLMVQSKTGSGKTAVYVLSFLEKFIRNREKGIRSSCLIVAPTRELAQQISDDAQILCCGVSGFHIGVFYGGVGYDHQKKLLDMGCDIYVGTPGRLLEFMDKRMLDTRNLDTFVIDEADRLFDMGFYPDIKKMFKYLPPIEQRQTMLFSATLEMRVRQLAWEHMNSPVEIEIEPEHITVENIDQCLYHVAKSEKFGLFLQLLAQEQPKAAIVFTNSRHMAEEVSARLSLNGYNSDYLTGDLPQAQRQKALDRMKEGKTAILVATDVAARGLQIDDLPLVVNYDIPEDYENYVHRIGRTARAGKSGKSITLADEEFVYGLEPIEKYIKMKIPVIWPDNLPDVQDASLGKSWRTRSPQQKTGQKKSSGNGQKPRQHSDRKTSKPEQPGKQTKPQQKTEARPSKPLGQMTEKERMEYYRTKYGFEPKENAKPGQKTSSQKSSAQKPAAKKTAGKPEQKVEQKVEQKPSESPATEKKGFFARLFGKKK